MLSGKKHIKTIIRYHYILIRVASLRTWTTSNTDDNAEQQELSFMAGGIPNGTATLEDTLVISYKTE